MKCARCGQSKAPWLWRVQACADKGKVRRKYLCNEHDLELNRAVLLFFGIPDIEAKMATYEAGMTHGTDDKPGA